MENRTLRLAEEGPFLVYQYEVCTKKIIGICFKRSLKVETWDLTDQNVRKELIDMGFVVKVREKL